MRLILVADHGQILGLIQVLMEGYLPLRTGRRLLLARFTAGGGNQEGVKDLFLHGHVLKWDQAEVLQ